MVLDSPGYVHLIGSYTTVDWQIAYIFGAPALVTPETPKPGYDKEGKRLVGEQAIAPKPEGSRWGWRTFLANTTLTFGIKNIFDAHPPLSIDQIVETATTLIMPTRSVASSTYRRRRNFSPNLAAVQK